MPIEKPELELSDYTHERPNNINLGAGLRTTNDEDDAVLDEVALDEDEDDEELDGEDEDGDEEDGEEDEDEDLDDEDAEGEEDDSAEVGASTRNRDAEDTRSRNAPVRSGSGGQAPTLPRGGVR